MLHIPSPKCGQFSLSPVFFLSLTKLFPKSGEADDSIGFSTQSLDKQSLGKGCL